MKKAIKFSVILLMCLYGCSGSDNELRNVLKNTVREHLDLATHDPKGYSILKLSDITAFEWDKFYVFDEYITNKQIKEIIGITWNGASLSEGQKRILFINRLSVVRYVDFDPSDFPLFIYLCGPNDQYLFSKSDDPFGVFKSCDHGHCFWAMVPLRCIKDFKHMYKNTVVQK